MCRNGTSQPVHAAARNRGGVVDRYKRMRGRAGTVVVHGRVGAACNKCFYCRRCIPAQQCAVENHGPVLAEDRPHGVLDHDRQPLPAIETGHPMMYEAGTVEGQRRTVTEVSRETKKIWGVDTVAVHDTVTLDGKPTEDTWDWFAQDREGNVWYFGEATKAFDAGRVDTTGSFEAGVDGAQPGIIMPGNPQVGDQYRQEYAKGVAEDAGEVLSLTGSEATPLTGPAKDLLITKDSDLLDPSGPAENKYYARGVGLILTVQTTGSAEREQATALEKFSWAYR